MKRFFMTWLISALSLIITAYLMTHFMDGFELQGPQAAAIAALVLGFANATIRPILSFLTLPFKCLTLGLFSFVVNAFTLWGVSLFSPGFQIDGVLPALIGSLVLTLISNTGNMLFNRKEKNKLN